MPVSAATAVPVAAGWLGLVRRRAVGVRPPDAPDEAKSYRIAMFGRLGAAAHGASPCAAHFVGLVGRGMAADPNRVPWGNMYEFTITGAFVVVFGYLLLRKRYGLAWMGPIVTAMAVVLLMVAVLWLYDPVAPLTEALLSYWLVIHVVSAIIATGAFTLGGITAALYLVKSRSLARGTAATAATSRGCPHRPRSTGCPTGSTRSASRSGPSRC